MKTLGIIPARYHSSRFPGKVLAEIQGRSILQRVYERAQEAKLDKVIVATDHSQIKDHVEDFGGKAVMTSEKHASGTERCAEAYQQCNQDFQVIINIQADEPFIEAEQVQTLRDAFSDHSVAIATLIKKIEEPDDLFSPNVVKVVKNQDNQAMLFSRTTIPYLREVKLAQWISQYTFYSHLGIYAYKSEVLKSLVHLPETSLEQAESLEQLRWLEHGYSIKVLESKGTGISVDTPSDLEKARNYAFGTQDV